MSTLESFESFSNDEASSGNSLLHSFGLAALFLLAGVIATGLYLRMESQAPALSLPALPKLSWTAAATQAAEGEDTWVAKGDAAFTAGRMVEPVKDNALYYYSLAAKVQPESDAVRTAVERMLAYLHSNAEQAVFRNDWVEAERYAGWMLELAPGHVDAEALQNRVQRLERVEALTQQALVQMSESKLVTPKGNNALDTYQRILRLDPTNTAAQQGIESVAQRLVAAAQAAAFADENEAANWYLDQVKAINPDTPGLAETRKLAAQRDELIKNQDVQQQLVAAAQALQSGRLVTEDNDGALARFEEVLAVDPDSAPAQQGKRLVAEALVSDARSQLAAGDLGGARETIAFAIRAGASEASIDSLREELAYQERLAAARQGEFERIYSISELELIRQPAPEFPRRAADSNTEGWVQVMFTVGVDGAVVDSEVEASSAEIFERPAVAAINRWRFAPVYVDGRPVPVRSGVRITFQQ